MLGREASVERNAPPFYQQRSRTLEESEARGFCRSEHLCPVKLLEVKVSSYPSAEYKTLHTSPEDLIVSLKRIDKPWSGIY